MSWNRQEGKSEKTTNKRRGGRFRVPPVLLVPLVLLVLAAGVWWAVRDAGSVTVSLAEASPLRRGGSIAVAASASSDAPRGETSSGVEPNAQDRRSTAPADGGGEEEPDEEEVSPAKEPRRESNVTGTDQLLSMASALAAGQSVPPLPISKDLDREFIDSLRKPIVVFDEDSEQTKRIKENMMQMREEMARMMEEGGGSVSQILREHEKIANENIAIHREAMAELRRICEESDEEEAEKYLKAMNSAFREMGIRQLEMPSVDADGETSTEEDGR